MSLFAEYKKERERKEVLETEHGFAVYGFPNESVCYLEEIFVTPIFRGTGLGQKLAEEIQEIARMHGCKKLVGSVATNAANPHYNMMLLIKFGFKLGDAKDDTVYFVKEL